MPDQRLLPYTRKRIENHDYEAVFAHGGCFHFALRLHEKFSYKIRGIREGHDGGLSHVWCRCLKAGDGRGIDIRGIYDEALLAKLANGGKEAEIYDVSVDELRTAIARKEYPPDLEMEIFQLADRIVDTHERFAAVKPSDDNAYAQFAKNMENRASILHNNS